MRLSIHVSADPDYLWWEALDWENRSRFVSTWNADRVAQELVNMDLAVEQGKWFTFGKMTKNFAAYMRLLQAPSK